MFGRASKLTLRSKTIVMPNTLAYMKLTLKGTVMRESKLAMRLKTRSKIPLKQQSVLWKKLLRLSRRVITELTVVIK